MEIKKNEVDIGRKELENRRERSGKFNMRMKKKRSEGKEEKNTRKL